MVIQVLKFKLGITIRVSVTSVCHCSKSPDESLEQGWNASR